MCPGSLPGTARASPGWPGLLSLPCVAGAGGGDEGDVVARVVRGVGWLLVVAGAVVLLYVVYLLWFTNLGSDRAQRDLAETWSLTVPDNPVATEDDEVGDGDADGDADEPPSPGSAYAALWFERDGERVVTDDVVYVVEGVDWETLKLGPGRYPGSDRVGGAGNLSIAGHRQGWGAPFLHLDQLQVGDTIHVVDRDGREWVYAFREQQIVAPTDTWVIDQDPLGRGEPTITLTTCHPLYSSAERLIAFGELLDEPLASEMGEPVSELAES
jgi:sortase A